MQSQLGHITKKKRVTNQCRKVQGDVADGREKYRESMACVLGNSSLYGGEEEKEKMSETTSKVKVVNLVMEAKGSKKGLAQLRLREIYQHILDSMQVPD